MKRLDTIALCILFVVMLSAFSQPKSAPGDGLWLRIIGDANHDIAVHSFSASVWFWAQGKATQTQVINFFDLQGDDLTDGSAIKATFTGSMSVADSAVQALNIHWGLISAEAGAWTCPRFNTEIGTSWTCP